MLIQTLELLLKQTDMVYGLKVANLAEFDKKLDLILADSNLRISMGWNGYKYLLENYTVDKSVSIIMSHFYSPYHS